MGRSYEREKWERVFEIEGTMCMGSEGPTLGKNRENFGGSKERSGACSERKAGEASEGRPTKLVALASPFLGPVLHPMAGLLLSVAASLPQSSEEGEIGAGPSGCPSRSVLVPRGPAQEWKVMLGFIQHGLSP